MILTKNSFMSFMLSWFTLAAWVEVTTPLTSSIELIRVLSGSTLVIASGSLSLRDLR